MPKSGGGPFFPGTINLDGTTLIAVVRDIIREWVRHGVKRLCFLDGHFENQWFITEGIDVAVREIRDADMKVMRFEYWDFFNDKTLHAVFPSGDFSSIAAGACGHDRDVTDAAFSSGIGEEGIDPG